jgi:hypothetical protein
VNFVAPTHSSVVLARWKHPFDNNHTVNDSSLQHTLIPAMAPNLTLFSVNAILILSTDDSTRILAKYYTAPHAPAGTPAGSTTHPGSNPYPSVKDQKAFEKGLLEKTAKQTTDVILYDNRVVVYKQESDVMLVGYVCGVDIFMTDRIYSTWWEVLKKTRFCSST